MNTKAFLSVRSYSLIISTIILLSAPAQASAVEKCLIDSGVSEQYMLYTSSGHKRPLRFHQDQLSGLWAQQAIGSLYIHQDVKKAPFNRLQMQPVNLVVISSGIKKSVIKTRGASPWRGKKLDILPSAQYSDRHSYNSQTLITNYNSETRRNQYSLTGSYWVHYMLSEKNLSAAINGHLIGDFIARDEIEANETAQFLNQMNDQKPQIIFLSTESILTPELKQALTYQANNNKAIIVTGAGHHYPQPLRQDILELKRLTNDRVIIVGSLSPDGMVSAFSQQGPEVDILAPADEFLLTLFGVPSSENFNLYPVEERPFTDSNFIKTTRLRSRISSKKIRDKVDYTNAAAAFVAGSLANALSLRPHLSIEQLRHLMNKTATPVIPSRAPFQGVNGHGMINAYKIYRSAYRMAINPRRYRLENRETFDFTRQVKIWDNTTFNSEDPRSAQPLKLKVSKYFDSILKDSLYVSSQDQYGRSIKIDIPLSCELRNNTIANINKSFLLTHKNSHRLKIMKTLMTKPFSLIRPLKEQREFYKSMRRDDYTQCKVALDGSAQSKRESLGYYIKHYRTRSGKWRQKRVSVGPAQKDYIHSRLRDRIIRESSNPLIDVHNAYVFLSRFPKLFGEDIESHHCLTRKAIKSLRHNLISPTPEVDFSIERALALGPQGFKIIKEAFSKGNPDSMARAIPAIGRVVYGQKISIWKKEIQTLITEILSLTLNDQDPDFNDAGTLSHVSNNLMLLNIRLTSLSGHIHDAEESKALMSEYLKYKNKNFKLFQTLTNGNLLSERTFNDYKEITQQTQYLQIFKDTPLFTNMIREHQELIYELSSKSLQLVARETSTPAEVLSAEEATPTTEVTEFANSIEDSISEDNSYVTQSMWEKVNEVKTIRCRDGQRVKYKYVDIRDLAIHTQCKGAPFKSLVKVLSSSFSQRHFHHSVFRENFYPLKKGHKSPGAWQDLLNKTDVIYGVEIEDIQRVTQEPSCGNKNPAQQIDIIAFYNSSQLKRQGYSRSGVVFKRLRLYLQGSKVCARTTALPHSDSQPIKVEDTHCQLQSGLMEFKHVLTCYKHGIRKIYPIGIGALDTGVKEVRRLEHMNPNKPLRDLDNPVNVSVTSMTDLFPEGSYLPRSFVMRNRTLPDYYEGLPFIRYFNANKGYSQLGSHIQQNTKFVRGVDSHGCNRLRPKDLSELNQIVQHGCHPHTTPRGKAVGCAVPFSSYYRLSQGPQLDIQKVDSQVDHPMSIRKWKIKSMLNVGTWFVPIRLRAYTADRLTETVTRTTRAQEFDRILHCIRDEGTDPCTMDEVKTTLLELEPEANPNYHGQIDPIMMAANINDAQSNRRKWYKFKKYILGDLGLSPNKNTALTLDSWIDKKRNSYASQLRVIIPNERMRRFVADYFDGRIGNRHSYRWNYERKEDGRANSNVIIADISQGQRRKSSSPWIFDNFFGGGNDNYNSYNDERRRPEDRYNDQYRHKNKQKKRKKKKKQNNIFDDIFGF